MKNEDAIVEVQVNAKLNDVVYKEIKEPYGFIYVTTNLINGKKYLGQRTFHNGWETYLGSGIAFKRAIEQYKKENFKRNIVLVCYSEEELNQAEYDLSVFLDVVESDNWYNLVLGGGTSRGWHPSEETKRKISDAAKERFSDPTNHPLYGKSGLGGERNPQFGVSPKERMDEETYKQWYEKHKPYWENSPSKGKRIWTEDRPNPNFGKQMSKEQKGKISQARLNKHIGCKPIYSIEFNKIYFGAREISEELGINKTNISMCCNKVISSCGKHPDTGEPLHWMYVYDNVKKDGTVISGALTHGYVTQEQLNNYLCELKGE